MPDYPTEAEQKSQLESQIKVLSSHIAWMEKALEFSLAQMEDYHGSCANEGIAESHDLWTDLNHENSLPEPRKLIKELREWQVMYRERIRVYEENVRQVALTKLSLEEKRVLGING